MGKPTLKYVRMAGCSAVIFCILYRRKLKNVVGKRGTTFNILDCQPVSFGKCAKDTCCLAVAHFAGQVKRPVPAALSCHTSSDSSTTSTAADTLYDLFIILIPRSSS